MIVYFSGIYCTQHSIKSIMLKWNVYDRFRLLKIVLEVFANKLWAFFEFLFICVLSQYAYKHLSEVRAWAIFCCSSNSWQNLVAVLHRVYRFKILGVNKKTWFNVWQITLWNNFPPSLHSEFLIIQCWISVMQVILNTVRKKVQGKIVKYEQLSPFYFLFYPVLWHL